MSEDEAAAAQQFAQVAVDNMSLTLNAIAALRPTADLRGIQDHIASRGFPMPHQSDVLDAIELLERTGQVRRQPDEIEESGRFIKRRVYYTTIDGGYDVQKAQRQAQGAEKRAIAFPNAGTKRV